MKYLLLTIPFGAFIITGAIATCNQNYGVTHCDAVTVENIRSNGFTELNGTTVKNEVYVNGSFSATKARLNKVTVNGSAMISDTSTKGEIEINGSLSANASVFNKTISLASNESRFCKSRVNNLVIKNITPIYTQKIYFRDKSQVNSITFESGHGVVYISENSTLGSLTGGKLIRISNND